MTSKRLAIIGAEGMVGSDLVRYLENSFQITPITKENYRAYIGTSFEVVVNANGNSRRFWANQHIFEDFLASTASVYQSIVDFSCKTYIYISSPDVYENHTKPIYTKENSIIHPQYLAPYGFHKYVSELIVKKYMAKFFILRCSMLLGTNLKKGPFFDIVHGNPLFISSASKLQLITTRAVSEIVNILLKAAPASDTINLGGVGTFSFKNIRKYFYKEIQISPDAEIQRYEMNIEKLKRWYPKLSTSEQYLRDFLKDDA